MLLELSEMTLGWARLGYVELWGGGGSLKEAKLKGTAWGWWMWSGYSIQVLLAKEKRGKMRLGRQVDQIAEELTGNRT